MRLLIFSNYRYNIYMPKTWKLKPEVPEEVIKKLAQYPLLNVQLLYNRGLTDEPGIFDFLNPKYEQLPSPFLFSDMEKAVARIWQAIEQKQKICIYGDYDADAVTANAVLQQTFRYLGVAVESYIPDRFTEGYGLNLEAFQKIKDMGVALIITVDCGTNSVDAAEFCAANGMDLIITDHHEIIGPKPGAQALINPKNPNDTYPYHEITGVGVAFKLACGLLSKKEKVEQRLTELGQKMTPGWEKWLLDLVAIGTVADCHSLLGENRILVKFGLQVLQKTKWMGLRALMETAKLDFLQRPFDTYTLGFIIAPRLNAAGRLEHANIALHLLLQTDPVKALEQAKALEQINLRRQTLTAQVMSEAREQIEQIKDRKILVLWGQDWPKGVVGLVAGKIAEEFHKPTIVLQKGETEATGSARTAGEFNLVEALKSTSEFLVRFGGHQQAAGLTLASGSFDQFYARLLDYGEQHLTPADLQAQLVLEAEARGADLTLNLLSLLDALEPFGVGNPRPLFLIKNAQIVSTRAVGTAQQHLQFQLEIGANRFGAIMFNCFDFAKNLKTGDTIDIAAEVMADNWNGRKGLKLRLVDITRGENRIYE